MENLRWRCFIQLHLLQIVETRKLPRTMTAFVLLLQWTSILILLQRNRIMFSESHITSNLTLPKKHVTLGWLREAGQWIGTFQCPRGKYVHSTSMIDEMYEIIHCRTSPTISTLGRTATLLETASKKTSKALRIFLPTAVLSRKLLELSTTPRRPTTPRQPGIVRLAKRQRPFTTSQEMNDVQCIYLIYLSICLFVLSICLSLSGFQLIPTGFITQHITQLLAVLVDQPCSTTICWFRAGRKQTLKTSWMPNTNTTYAPENSHDIGKSPFSIGNTSSNGGVSIVMLVFWGVRVLT